MIVCLFSYLKINLHQSFPSISVRKNIDSARRIIHKKNTVVLAIPKMLGVSLIIPMPNFCVLIGDKNAYAGFAIRASSKRCAAIPIAEQINPSINLIPKCCRTATNNRENTIKNRILCKSP